MKINKLLAAIAAMSIFAVSAVTAAAAEPSVSVWAGDATKDELVDVIDLVRMKKYFANAATEISFAGADVDGDGLVETEDMVSLKKILVGIEYTYEKLDDLGDINLTF